MVNVSWCLVISCNKFSSIVDRMNDQRTNNGAAIKYDIVTSAFNWPFYSS